VSGEEDGAKGGRTFLRNVFPVPVVEFNLGSHRFADQFLRVLGPKRSVTAKQHICDDTKCAVNSRVHTERDEDAPG